MAKVSQSPLKKKTNQSSPREEAGVNIFCDLDGCTPWAWEDRGSLPGLHLLDQCLQGRATHVFLEGAPKGNRAL